MFVPVKVSIKMLLKLGCSAAEDARAPMKGALALASAGRSLSPSHVLCDVIFTLVHPGSHVDLHSPYDAGAPVGFTFPRDLNVP